MPLTATDPIPLASLHAMGVALATDPREVLIGFIAPAPQMGKPVWLRDRHFPGARLYAMTRGDGVITAVTYQIDEAEVRPAVLRPDGDWQIPACELDAGQTRLLVTAHTADGQLAQAGIILVVPHL